MALCAIMLAISISPVYAGQIARALGNSAVTTASWGIVTVGQNQSATNAPFTLTWTVSGGSAYNYFNFRNTGSTSVNRFQTLINQTRVGGNAPPSDIFFEECRNGTWDALTNACSGTVILIGKALDLTLTFSNLNLVPGAALNMRARTTVSGRNNFSTQLNTHVSRSDIRAAVVSHS